MCADCSALNSQLAGDSPSSCECMSNYYASNTNPLECTQCHNDCTDCTGGGSALCTGCSALNSKLAGDSPNSCECNSNYYTSSTNPLECTQCHYDCTDCTGGGSALCTGCSALNSQLAGDSPNSCECMSNYYTSDVDPLKQFFINPLIQYK